MIQAWFFPSVTDGAEQHREKHQVTATGCQGDGCEENLPPFFFRIWDHSRGELSPKQPYMMVFVVFFFPWMINCPNFFRVLMSLSKRRTECKAWFKICVWYDIPFGDSTICELEKSGKSPFWISESSWKPSSFMDEMASTFFFNQRLTGVNIRWKALAVEKRIIAKKRGKL